MKNWGLPYQGSKNRIAPKIIEQLPSADVFVDCMAGGCAVTHAALLSGKYKKVIANDINTCPVLFKQIMGGEKPHDYHWVSREEFFDTKEDWIKICYSFANNRLHYAFGKNREPLVKALHYAVVNADFSLLDKQLGLEIAMALKDRIGVVDRLSASTAVTDKRGLTVRRRTICTNLTHLLRLERLERLEQSATELEVLTGTYETLPILENAVYYCDIPYEGTNCGSYKGFDHKAFYQWTKALPNCYLSEYSCSDPSFKQIWQIEKQTLAGPKATEKLYVKGISSKSS